MNDSQLEFLYYLVTLGVDESAHTMRTLEIPAIKEPPFSGWDGSRQLQIVRYW